jgi:hypothetical protein
MTYNLQVVLEPTSPFIQDWYDNQKDIAVKIIEMEL